MNCHRLHQKLAQAQPLTEEEREHAADCTACAVLLEDERVAQGLEAVWPASADTPALDFSAIEADIKNEHGMTSWMRSRTSGMRILLALGASMVLALFSFVAMPRPDLSVYPGWRMALTLIALTIAVGAAAVLSLRGLHRAPVPSRLNTAVVVVAGLVLPFAIALLPAAHAAHPAALAGAGDDFAAHALECFLLGVGFAIPALVVMRLLSRDAHARLPLALLAAASAGATANIALQLHCPIVHPLHLAAGHASVAAVALAVYAAVVASKKRRLST